jgi:hypothetical protein
MIDDVMREPVRVNTRISADTNDWLDKKVQEMALTKSALINIAVENYRKEQEVTKALPDMMVKLKELGLEI